jgi:hypothetical protein
VCCIAAQNVTVSKDSLNIYNDHLSSFADEVAFVCNTSASTSLDSAFITIDEIDTAGSTWYVTEDRLQVRWLDHLQIPNMYYWNLVKSGPDRFRLIRRDSSTSDIQPLSFSAQIPQRRIVMMEIGGCLGCSGLPTWYPPFLRGSLILHFSSGQTISLRLYSDDLRKPVNYGEPCNDLACDTLNVRTILDRNGMESVPVSKVATTVNGRVTILQFAYNPISTALLPKQIKVIPPELGNLTALKSLTASGNAFDSFPQQIGGCAGLETILADNNGMTKLPDSIVKCTHLRFISLENNRLTQIPDSIGKLKKLKSLSITENHLTSLPSSMADLDSIQCLYIAGNRICTLPEPLIAWISDVHTNTICARYEPIWPDSQQCTSSISKRTPDTRPAPEFIVRPIVREGGSIMLTFGPLRGDARRIEIFDLSGRTAATMHLPAGGGAIKTVRLNAVRVPAGWYCLRVISDAGNDVFRPFVVNR